jgi:hypothetical protein
MQTRSNPLEVCKLCESATIDLSHSVIINTGDFKPLYQARAGNIE